jgi:hypothetical protein
MVFQRGLSCVLQVRFTRANIGIVDIGFLGCRAWIPHDPNDYVQSRNSLIADITRPIKKEYRFRLDFYREVPGIPCPQTLPYPNGLLGHPPIRPSTQTDDRQMGIHTQFQIARPKHGRSSDWPPPLVVRPAAPFLSDIQPTSESPHYDRKYIQLITLLFVEEIL